MNNFLTIKGIKQASAQGKKMADARWKKHRELTQELEKLAAIDPLRVPGKIIQRVVVIWNESEVTEIVRRDTTSQREWARLKKRASL